MKLCSSRFSRETKAHSKHCFSGITRLFVPMPGSLSLKSYLFKAVKNRCLTLINRNEVKQRIEKMIFDNLQSQYDDPDFYAIQELTEKIEEALARLPENVREAFELNRFQNLTYNEIAERLGVSPKTIDYRIQQALKQLRIDLKEYLPLLLPFLLH